MGRYRGRDLTESFVARVEEEEEREGQCLRAGCQDSCCNAASASIAALNPSGPMAGANLKIGEA